MWLLFNYSSTITINNNNINNNKDFGNDDLIYR